MFWQGSYMKDNEHPAFNLAKNAEEKIAPDDNFERIVKVIKNS